MHTPGNFIIAVFTMLLLLVGCSAQEATVKPIPEPAQTPSLPGTPTQPDLSCKVAGDCEVKNVGNCCGYFPTCVNKDSVVDPEAVRAECARTGTSSICGWQDIQACDCIEGRCSVADPAGSTD